MHSKQSISAHHSCLQVSKYLFPIILNNPIKACFSDKIYPVAVQIQTVYFLLKYDFNKIFKFVGVQNRFPITFGTALITVIFYCNVNFDILLHIKAELKVIQK